MNSEELERSLRDEFETYLKGIAAELKQETAEFQQRPDWQKRLIIKRSNSVQTG